MICAFCGEPVTETNPPFEVTTWTRRRKQGGFHTLKGTNPTGRYAHLTCLDLSRAGHVPGQTSFL